MKRRILGIAIVLAMIIVMAMPMGVGAADNSGTQNASTSGSTNSISIVGKVADTAVTSITFPQGAPTNTISNPYNNVDTASNAQVLHASTSEPVARLKNNAVNPLKVTIAITSWTNAVVASEDYELVPTGTTTIATVASPLSADGTANSVATGYTITNGEYAALYLEVVLSANSAATGSSTITILGELP